MQRAAKNPYAVAVQRGDVPSRAPEGRKLGRVREASRAFLLLTRPEILGREAVSVRPSSVVVGELVTSPLGPMEGPTNELEGTIGRKRRCPDRNGEPIGDLMTELGKEREMGPGRKESVRKNSGSQGRAKVEPS